jgi:hypothetical protein
MRELYLSHVKTYLVKAISVHIEAVSGPFRADIESRGARLNQSEVFCGSQPNPPVRHAKNSSISAE